MVQTIVKNVDTVDRLANQNLLQWRGCASTDLLPLVLQRRSERIVVRQLTLFSHLLDDELVLRDWESLIDQEGFEGVVVDVTARDLLVFERKGLHAINEVADVLAGNFELANPDEEQARVSIVFGHAGLWCRQ